MSELLGHPRLRMLFLPLLPAYDEVGDPICAGREVLWVPDSAVDAELAGLPARHLRRRRVFPRIWRSRPAAPATPVADALDKLVVKILSMENVVRWSNVSVGQSGVGGPAEWLELVRRARQLGSVPSAAMPHWARHHHDLLDREKLARPRPPGPLVDAHLMRFVAWAFYWWSRGLLDVPLGHAAELHAQNALRAFLTCEAPDEKGALRLVPRGTPTWQEAERLRKQLLKLELVHLDEHVDAAVDLLTPAALRCLPDRPVNAPDAADVEPPLRTRRGESSVGEYRLAISLARSAFQPRLKNRTLHAAVGLAAAELGLDKLDRTGHLPGEVPSDDEEAPKSAVQQLDASWDKSLGRVRKELGWTGRIESGHLVFD